MLLNKYIHIVQKRQHEGLITSIIILYLRDDTYKHTCTRDGCDGGNRRSQVFIHFSQRISQIVWKGSIIRGGISRSSSRNPIDEWIGNHSSQ